MVHHELFQEKKKVLKCFMLQFKSPHVTFLYVVFGHSTLVCSKDERVHRDKVLLHARNRKSEQGQAIYFSPASIYQKPRTRLGAIGRVQKAGSWWGAETIQK